MESISGPLHSRKLSNGNGFSSKNAYDGSFSGQRKFGAPILSARVEDYREIFGSSQGTVSSVPVLDLSGFDDPNGASNLRSSKPDYSKIFGGCRDDDGGAVSYQELYTGVNVVKNSPEKARATSARRQPSQDSEDLFDTSNQSTDAVKQFNMSYHKITRRSKDGSNGTTHVTQLHDVPGFTTFIEEISTKADETQKSSPLNSIQPKSDGRPEVKHSKKAYEQTSGNAVKSKSGYGSGGSFSDDKLFNAYENNVKSHPSKLPPPSFMPPYSEKLQARSNGHVTSNSGGPEIDVSESDEELDVNSAAAASVAALKKAIEKAQESIRIAKESVGRKKEGLQGFSNKSFKDSLKVKGREATDKFFEGKCGSVDAASDVFDLTEKKNTCNGGVVGTDFKDSEKLFVSKKVIAEMHGKILVSARQCERSRWSISELKESERVLVSRVVKDETTGRNRESVEIFEASTVRTTNEILEGQGFIKKVDAVEKSSEVEDTEWKPNAEVGLHGLESACLVDEEAENELPSSKQEEQKILEKPQGFFKLVNFVKNLRGFAETMEDGKKVSDEVKDDDYRLRVNEAHNFVENENKLNDSQKMSENEQKDREATEQFETGKKQEEVLEEKNVEKSENENGPGKDLEHKIKESDVSNGRETEDTHKEEVIEKWLDEVHELGINEKGHTYVHNMDESEVKLQDEFKIKQDDSQKGEETEHPEEMDANDEKDSEETLSEKCKWAGDDYIVTEDYIYEERGSTASGTDGIIEENREIEIPHFVCEEIFSEDFDGFNHDMSSIAPETHDTSTVQIDDDNNVETGSGQEANYGGRSPKFTEVFSEFEEEKSETVKVSNRVQENEISEAAGWTFSEDDESEFEVKEVHEDFMSNGYEGIYGLGDKKVEVNEVGQTSGQSDFVEELIKKEVKISFPQEETKLFSERAHWWDLEGSHLPSIPKPEQTVEIKQEYKRSQYEEKTEENISRTTEDKKDKENELKKVVEEKKQVREVDEAIKRQRERDEKEKMAVERAIREARERAYAEAKERAERAAVERANAEVRQRVMVEARERSEKVSEKAKIRAERAAVERATEEARERALEKAMSQKTTTTSERFVSEKFFGASRDSGMRQSSSADLHGSGGLNSESAQRSKARLERHNRIMERASKALAEKEKRDLLTQIEQAERNRLAETLDAEVKRWSSGKEGNLRALLSTLQYILGSNSGWQPVSLTEIITTSAVKKAYRKATLAVHPDKLQQRGASIQHKYICEKVFDLLKAAWNRFDSEER